MSEEFDRVEMAQQIPPPPACPGGQLYTVRSGDTMFLIAQRHGITLDQLIQANPQITNPNLIFPGQQVCIPRAPVGQCPPGTTTYTVVSGDTLFEIARRFGVTLDALIRTNPQIPDPNRIFPGQIVCIPTTPEPVQCPNGFLYTVVAGDTMFEIARRFGVTLDALIRANPQIADPNRIFPGQSICIPFPAPPAFCSGQFYTVMAGDTLFTIAQRTGLTVQAILAANPQIVDPDRIFAGQVICLPVVLAPMPGPEPLPPRPVPLPMPIPPVPMPMPMPMPCPPQLPIVQPAPGIPGCPPYVLPLPYRCPDWDRCRKHRRHKHSECYDYHGWCPERKRRRKPRRRHRKDCNYRGYNPAT